MNRLIATLAVFAMMLLALGLSFQQTLANESSTPAILGFHILAAVGLLATAVIIVWRHTSVSDHLHRFSRSRAELLQPLRRLLSAVWS